MNDLLKLEWPRLAPKDVEASEPAIRAARARRRTVLLNLNMAGFLELRGLRGVSRSRGGLVTAT